MEKNNEKKLDKNASSSKQNEETPVSSKESRNKHTKELIEKEVNLASTTNNHSNPIDVNKSGITKEERNRDVKTDIEENTYNGNHQLIKFEELVLLMPEFAGWLKNICRYGNVDNMCLIFNDLNGEELKIRVKFFTTDNEYSIVAIPRPDQDKRSYLGCIVNSRKSRVGETWKRGNDLPDGDFSYNTWKDIVNRIVAYEMKTLQCWVK